MSTKIIQKQFQRIETKYVIDREVFEQLQEAFKGHLVADDFANSTITNIYFDSDDFNMIQDSLAKRNGREKIRMRIYDNNPQNTSEAFLEIKKKVNDIGYKYRLTSNPISIENFIKNGVVDETINNDKVVEELSILRDRYQGIKPMMYIYYDRVSFKGIEDSKVRVTIDQNLIYRDYNVSATSGKYGSELLPKDKVIMEIKVPGEQPQWLKDILEDFNLENMSFSKYGNAYKLSQGIAPVGGTPWKMSS